MPEPLSDDVRRSMQSQLRQDTRPELLLRRALFALGLRYRTGYKVPGLPRRTVDIAFTRAKVAVFVDGCFWHACPRHGVAPKHSAEWWKQKLEKNVARDRETSEHLEALGWNVVRVWEHESVNDAVEAVLSVLDAGPEAFR